MLFCRDVRGGVIDRTWLLLIITVDWLKIVSEDDLGRIFNSFPYKEHVMGIESPYLYGNSNREQHMIS